jgi:type VI secretion system secreted protein VgrG
LPTRLCIVKDDQGTTPEVLMPTPLTQKGRRGRLDTPMKEDLLCLVRFHGSEGASELFEYSIEALSTDANINFDDAIGKGCTLSFKTRAEPDRFFHGILVTASAGGGEGEYYNYRLVLRPWLWLLSRTSDCRIFDKRTLEDKTPNALNIILKVFKDRGFQDVRDATDGSFPDLEYCVQYRETDLAFVSRLMEQHGIYYFFEHESNKHTLVLANGNSSHKEIEGHAKIPVFLADSQERRDQEYLYDWLPERRFRSGKFTLTDYDYLNPNADLVGEKEGTAGYANSKMEIYDYPGKHIVKDEGANYSKYRLEAEQARDKRRAARGDAISLLPGGLVTLEKHPTAAENKQYLVVRAAHSYTGESYISGMSSGAPSYAGSYELLPADIPYRAPLLTPRPLVHGPQTAKVIGDNREKKEEIDVDEHGRILVAFFWDRKTAQSCRVRVAQIWAGANWGAQFIPRIGHEVVVEFLEGDPDRPIVTGSVYNKDNKYPYDMPEHKTQSGIKSHSTKNATGYNEIMFEDKHKSEMIRMHAQKDYNVTILHNETVWIGNSDTVTIQNSQKVTIGAKFKEGGAAGVYSRITTLEKGGDQLTIVDGDQLIDIVAGEQTVYAEKGITLTSPKKITLEVGGSSITLEPGTITLKSPLIKIN